MLNILEPKHCYILSDHVGNKELAITASLRDR